MAFISPFRALGPWLLALLMASTVWSAWAARAAPARTLQGVVSKVHDGDSLWFRPDAASAKGAVPTLIKVRLARIDAPELCQAWGPQARDALAERVLGKSVTLVTTGVDAHRRTLGKVRVDGVDVGQQLVEQGHAWSTRTRWDEGPLVAKERMARSLRRGLHAGPGAEMPWRFRQWHGPCINKSSAAAAQPPQAVPVSAQPAVPTPVQPLGNAVQPAMTPGPWRCDGRTHCSQMRSCDEAKFFLAHCPGVKMDGNRDGVPCERQWCGR